MCEICSKVTIKTSEDRSANLWKMSFKKFFTKHSTQTIIIGDFISFIRLRLDYCDIFYNQAYNVSFRLKVESTPHKETLAITGAIRGTSKDIFFEELGLESLQHRRWYRKLCCFYKVLKDQSSKYLFDIISEISSSHFTRNANNILYFKIKHRFFKNTSRL